MYGAVDRIENNKVIIIWDDNTSSIIENEDNLKEGDRVSSDNDKIKKIDNAAEKKKMIDLQNKILKKR